MYLTRGWQLVDTCDPHVMLHWRAYSGFSNSNRPQGNKCIMEITLFLSYLWPMVSILWYAGKRKSCGSIFDQWCVIHGNADTTDIKVFPKFKAHASSIGLISSIHPIVSIRHITFKLHKWSHYWWSHTDMQ